jgi:hypothetical protein
LVVPSAAADVADEYAIVAPWLLAGGHDDAIAKLRRAFLCGESDPGAEARAYVVRLEREIVRGIALDLRDVRHISAARDAHIVAEVMNSLGRPEAALWRRVSVFLERDADDPGITASVAAVIALGVAANHVADASS